MEKLKYILTKDMREFLDTHNVVNYFECEYCDYLAADIVKGGSVLFKHDTGFTQSYLVELGNGYYYVSLSQILRFTT